MAKNNNNSEQTVSDKSSAFASCIQLTVSVHQKKNLKKKSEISKLFAKMFLKHFTFSGQIHKWFYGFIHITDSSAKVSTSSFLCQYSFNLQNAISGCTVHWIFSIYTDRCQEKLAKNDLFKNWD